MFYDSNNRFNLTFSAILIIGGAAIYPIGWDNREVKESCGNQSSAYKLGKL